MALTEAAESVPAVTVRADAVFAVSRSRWAPPAVTVPVAATDPAVTTPGGCDTCGLERAVHRQRAARNYACERCRIGTDRAGGLDRPSNPHGLSDRQIAANGNIAARFQVAAQREAFSGDSPGSGNGVAAHVEIGLHPVGVREAWHSDPLEPAAVDGLVIEAAQRGERTHSRGAGKGRLEGAHVMIEGGSGQPGRGIGRDQAEACLAGGLQQRRSMAGPYRPPRPPQSPGRR